MSGSAPKLFISYRREETAGHAGRLYDVMSSRFGESNVFMDLSIAPGVDFVDSITEAVGKCHVLLVIMGPHWATATPGGALPRIFEPGDFVRLEVESGVRRSNVAVIPVLVGGAKMPDPTALPAPLRPLTRRNAIEVSDTRWRYDVDRLMTALDGLLGETPGVHHRVPAPAPVTPPPVPVTPVAPPPAIARPVLQPRAEAGPAQSRRQPWSFGGPSLFITTTLVALVAGLIGSGLGEKLKKVPNDSDHFDKVTRIVNEAGPAGVAWAIVGAAVAMWLAAWLPGRRASLGWLAVGGIAGGAAGLASAALVAVPRYRGLPDHHQPESTRHALLIVGYGLLGAVIGALVGWIWNRRGSAGLAVGLLAGALYQAAVYKDSLGDRYDLADKAGLIATLIVGLTTLTQVLLDALAERSPRALANSRGP